jgi:polyisoprenoid-binding protein YceI
MHQLSYLILSILLVTKLAFAAPGVEIDVKLSPAGSFKAKTAKIKGLAKQKGNLVIGNNIMVDLRSLDTGIALRDNHLKKRLLVEKFPVAKLLNAKGKEGKGEATLSMMGKEHKITGTYITKGNFLISEFKLKLSALGINDVSYMGVGVKDDVVITATVPVIQVPTQSVPRDISSEKGK